MGVSRTANWPCFASIKRSRESHKKVGGPRERSHAFIGVRKLGRRGRKDRERKKPGGELGGLGV